MHVWSQSWSVLLGNGIHSGKTGPIWVSQACFESQVLGCSLSRLHSISFASAIQSTTTELHLLSWDECTISLTLMPVTQISMPHYAVDVGWTGCLWCSQWVACLGKICRSFAGSSSWANRASSAEALFQGSQISLLAGIGPISFVGLMALYSCDFSYYWPI